MDRRDKFKKERSVVTKEKMDISRLEDLSQFEVKSIRALRDQGKEIGNIAYDYRLSCRAVKQVCSDDFNVEPRATGYRLYRP